MDSFGVSLQSSFRRMFIQHSSCLLQTTSSRFNISGCRFILFLNCFSRPSLEAICRQQAVFIPQFEPDIQNLFLLMGSDMSMTSKLMLGNEWNRRHKKSNGIKHIQYIWHKDKKCDRQFITHTSPNFKGKPINKNTIIKGQESSFTVTTASKVHTSLFPYHCKTEEPCQHHGDDPSQPKNHCSQVGFQHLSIQEHPVTKRFSLNWQNTLSS